MKKLTLRLMTWMLLLWSTGFSQNYIAVQSGAQVSLFTYLEDAIAAANAGDDIYLPGGIVQVHGDVTVDKQLSIYGVGYNDLANLATGRTSIPATLLFSQNAGGSFITGVQVNNVTTQSLDNFLIKRCWINSISLGNGNSNIYITESVFTQLHGGGDNDINVVVEKCIIGDAQSGGYPRINAFTGLTVKNSIISSTNHTFGYLINSTIENSIVMNVGSPSYSSYLYYGSGNLFKNCIFSRGEGQDYTLDAQEVTNAIYSQSLAATFVNYDGGEFKPSYDFHLTPSSPGNSAGTDATDIGIYGTAQPFKTNGLPNNPHIVSKFIGNSTDANGNLLINVKVEVQDH